ncbi:S1 family peptidase [Vibrio atypicus]|uniref:S1 family peptidase n=1 Tax=Vibrio atypicus TaxID=558271 RepID=UPI001359D955|nr:serine protease [Vibrio atypicus]
MIRILATPMIGAVALLSLPAQAQDITPRIIDGVEASQSDWPYMTALVFKGQSATDGQFCGGSYIGERYVLTAAHCVFGITADDLDVIVGINDLKNEGTEGSRLSVSKIYLHHEYTANSLENDVAILELPRKLSANEAIPVELANVNTRGETYVGAPLTVAGWGSTTPEYGNHTATDQLLEVTVPMVSQSDCATAFPWVLNDENSAKFCAGTNTEGYDSCRGDSGGPLVVESTGIQLGIVSYGSLRCGEQGSYGVYSNISYLNNWIEQHSSGFSYVREEFAGYRTPGSLEHDFVFQNFSNDAVVYKGVARNWLSSDFTIVANSCREDTPLSSGSQCVVRVSKNNPHDYGETTLSVDFSYEQNGKRYTVDSIAHFEVADELHESLADALSLSNGETLYSNEHPWQVTSNGLRSAPINDNERSTLIIDGLAPGIYSFDARISTEFVDYVYLYINGQIIDGIGGEHNFNQQIQLFNESNRIKFDYVKDGSISEGDDAVYITNFRKGVQTSSGGTNTSGGGGGGSLGWLSLLALLPLLRRRQ